MINANFNKAVLKTDIRGAFGKFLAWYSISVTDLQTLSCYVMAQILWGYFLLFSNCVQSISHILCEVGIPNLVLKCILG